MGKVEKVVVLSVLFLMVVIFVVSIPDGPEGQVDANRVYAAEKSVEPRLRTDTPKHLEVAAAEDWRTAAGAKPSVGKRAPGSAPKAVAKGPKKAPVVTPSGGSAIAEPAGPQPRTENLTAPEADGLLSRTVKTPVAKPQAAKARQPKKQAPAAVKLQASWDLIRAEGLRNTLNPEFKVYTCKANDTFDSLAKLYYGDKRFARFLRRNNEGVATPTAGLELLMPCRNLSPLGEPYTVQPGDSLWTIAQSQYGDGSRWRAIYDANRETLRSPDALKAGQSLLIP